MPKFYDRCCNPLNLEKHSVKKSLRQLSKNLVVCYNLSTGDHICSMCHKKLVNPMNNTNSTHDYSDKSSNTEILESFGNEQDDNSELIDVGDSQYL
ncbi:hypothetical protein PV327_010100 [Microctonus hyperodae]|uniref:Uncharacterized protein n=1 Tax=Microctonus hyperodae TaxID=165561 RepID=A0AA39F2D0_MICHY|nr:hypothetical protein PV327_010100 [Microctonus hyperodae]